MARPAESSIVTKCARVMDVLSHARKPLVFSDIVAQTQIVKSSCHRVLAVLKSEGLINYDHQGRTYTVGPRFQDWARASWQRADLQEVALSPMTQLGEEAGMNVALSVLDQRTILYLRAIEQVPVRYAARAGDHAPLHSTAAGKVFLAHMGEERRNALLGAEPFERFTEFTRTSLTDMAGEFRAIVEQGFATAIREELPQVMGLSAPIWNEQNEIAACLSLWTLTEAASEDQLLAQAGRVRLAAREISTRIGWKSA